MRKSRKINPGGSRKPYSLLSWMEDMVTRFKKKKLLLRGEMVRLRLLRFPWPPIGFSGTFPQTMNSVAYTLSNVAGHGAFICLALSYLEKDFLSLRLYALSGISLNMIFQYYRPLPLWIPLRWNSLFWAINAAMIVLLLKEANDAYHIPDDQRKLYEGLYERRGMSLLDFLFLMTAAEKVVLKEGDRVITMGKENHHVYVVINGSLCVMKKGRFVCKLNELMFAGEMSFLRWKSHSQIRDDGEVSSADVTCLEECVLYRWTFRDLDQLMKQNATIGMIFEGCISSEVNRKFHAEERSRTLRLYEHMLHGAMMDGELNDKEKDNLAEFRQKNSINDQEHVQLIRDLGWTMAEFEAGSKGGPELPVLEEYYDMLDGELRSGSLTPQGRSKLRQYRMYYLVTSDKHLDFLAQLGWTMDEYEAGRKFTLAEQVSLTSRGGSGRVSDEEGQAATRTPAVAVAGGGAAPGGPSADDKGGRPGASGDTAAHLQTQPQPPSISP